MKTLEQITESILSPGETKPEYDIKEAIIMIDGYFAELNLWEKQQIYRMGDRKSSEHLINGGAMSPTFPRQALASLPRQAQIAVEDLRTAHQSGEQVRRYVERWDDVKKTLLVEYNQKQEVGNADQQEKPVEPKVTPRPKVDADYTKIDTIDF